MLYVIIFFCFQFLDRKAQSKIDSLVKNRKLNGKFVENGLKINANKKIHDEGNNIGLEIS